MTEGDIPSLVLMEKRLFPNPWNDRDFHGELCFHGSFCRILGQEEIFAYACSRQLPDGFELLRIATHPDFQGRGFAGLLLGELFLLSRDAVDADIFLEVAANNEKALAFYTKHGFIRCGIRKAYYPGGMDALNLVKYGVTK